VCNSAYSNDPDSYDNYTKLAYLSFFDLLYPLGVGWQIITLILVTALAANSIDSLQNAMMSLFSGDLIRMGYNPQCLARSVMVVINFPAIILAAHKFDVIELFLVADLVCASSVFPVFLGLQRKDYGLLIAPTELGAFLGCVSGIVTVLVNSAINGNPGGVWEYFWLRNNAICAVCGTKTMITFIITPLVSLVMTYVFSWMDVLVRGDRAREPIFTLPFDKEIPHGSEGHLASNKAPKLQTNKEVDESSDESSDIDNADTGV
jgi:solute:Na+ symporter, SSS family